MITFLRRYPLLSFYAISFGLTLIILLTSHFFFNDSIGVQWLGAFFPAITAIGITYLLHGTTALEHLLKGLFKWRVGWQWYLLIFLLPILWTIATVTLYRWTGGTQNADLLPWLEMLPKKLPAIIGIGLLFAV